MTKHMNIVRYKPKYGQKDLLIKAHNNLKISSWKGCLSMKLVDCGEWLCGMMEWESAEHLKEAMPQLISFLDTWRDNLEEISPELGVTDPMSGSIVVDV